ncbi:MAG: cytochrome c-type biogenesis CcmF C-terminal domain-containing protein, partial [Novosphingobium sp.]
VVAHFGIAVALIGMASDTAYSVERLVAMKPGQVSTVGPWTVKLSSIEPVAGPNWTAMEGRMEARYGDEGRPDILAPQARSFWSPEQQTSETALLTRWNGQLYAVVGDEADDGRWQVRLWWKPFVTLIWLGGLLIALGGFLALVGRVLSDWRRRVAVVRIAERKQEVGQ